MKKSPGMLKMWQRRWFVLEPATLTYYKSHDEVGIRFQKQVPSRLHGATSFSIDVLIMVDFSGRGSKGCYSAAGLLSFVDMGNFAEVLSLFCWYRTSGPQCSCQTLTSSYS